MDYRELIKDFLFDAESHLSVFDGALMSFERGAAGKELISDTLGALHTLKGNSGMMGFIQLKDFIHAVEEVLKNVLEGRNGLPEVLDTLMESANVIRGALAEIEKHSSLTRDFGAEIARLRSAGQGDGNGKNTPLAGVAELSSYLGSKADSIKVDFKRLDDLLSLVGELVIFKTRISQIQSRLKELPSGRQISGELKEVIESAGKTISGLQEGVMRARMMPVGFVFRKFTRMARDLARSQGKEAQVLLQGEETELDKTVIDELREPLLHLIRNAVDHGIESPSERTRAGKPPSGKITLSAIQESSYVIIKINDDGKGIDPERVRDKAVEKGLIRDGAELPEEELRQIIFTPGFSTRDSSTDISGRGIGLDIVSKNISRLNGQVSVESQKATGSTFIIKLPLSLAIIPALMAEVSDETFAIPISGVDESVRAQEQDIHVVDGKEVIRLREKIVPVLRLGDFFGLGRRNGSGRFYLVVVGKAEKKLALAVDRLAGQQEIVIKPLDDTFGQSRGISGASILGSGKIVLIVDLLNLWGRGNFSPAAPCENQGGKQDGY